MPPSARFPSLIERLRLFVCALLFASAQFATAQTPLGTSISYQGGLVDSGSPANASYDFLFTLYDDETAGSVAAGPLSVDDVDVAEGLFTVELDFGSGAFDGNQRWLEIQVSPAGDATFETLSPRQELAPAAYALYAASSAAGDRIQSASGGTAAVVSDDGRFAVSGASANTASADNAVAVGGINNVASSDRAAVFSGSGNTASGTGAAIVGGINNAASSSGAAVFAGSNNEASGAGSAIVGGSSNTASNSTAAIFSGGSNEASGAGSTIVGGSSNTASSSGAAIFSGFNNEASGLGSTIAGGSGNTADGEDSAVVGGGANTASGGDSAVLGGFNNEASGSGSAALGGFSHLVSGSDSAIVAGTHSEASGSNSAVLGGASHIASGFASAVVGGNDGEASGSLAVVVGGLGNTAAGASSLAAGQQAEAATDNTFVWSDGTSAPFTSQAANTFLVEASGGVGINTNAPEELLHVSGGDLLLDRGSATDGVNRSITIEGAQSGSGIYGRLNFQNYDVGRDLAYIGAAIRSENDGTGNERGDLRFYTASTPNLLEKMIIDYDGKVGIGTSLPNEALEVNGQILSHRTNSDATSSGFIVSPSTAGYGVDPELVIQAVDVIVEPADAPFHISRNATYDSESRVYEYIDDGGTEEASRILFDNNGDIAFSYAPAGTGTVTWTDYMTLDGDTGTVTATAFAGDGSGLTGINIDGGDADTLDGLDSTDFVPYANDAFVIVQTTGDAAANGTNLLAAYAAASALTPNGSALSADNRATVLVPPGNYDLGTSSLTLDAEFVNLIGLSTDPRDQYIFGESGGASTGVLMQTADDAAIENLRVECTRSSGGRNNDDTDPAAYFPSDNLPSAVVRNCVFEANDSNAFSMRTNIEYSGTYEDIEAGDRSFGGGGGEASNNTTDRSGTASGTFTRCSGGEFAFAGGIRQAGMASGTFTDCLGGDHSFAGHLGVSGSQLTGTASGVFINCSGGESSFGGSDGDSTGGTASGTFTNCSAGDFSFAGAGDGGTASGTFTNCSAEDFSFAGACLRGGTASGTFTNCSGGSRAFAGGDDGEGVASGTFTNCLGGSYSFAPSGTAPGGRFYHCEGGINSFTNDKGSGSSPLHLDCLVNGSLYSGNDNDADTLDGRNSTDFDDAKTLDGLDSTDFLDKTTYDSEDDGEANVHSLDASDGSATDALFVDADGEVGIGTTTPATPLALLGNGGTNPVGITQNQVGGVSTMELTTADGSGNQATRLLLRGNGDTTDIEFYTGARGSETATMFIEGDDGNVGVGTTSPENPLHIMGSGNTNMRLETTASGSNAQAGVVYENAVDSWYVGLRGNDNDFIFYETSNNAVYLTIEDGGDVGLRNNNPAHPLHVGTNTTNGNGAHVTTGGAWTNGSSREWKTNFRQLDGRDILERVVGLPVSRWEYDGSDEGDHIGPTAEDFRAAFGLGRSDQYIATVDADGVALAAIQGLNAKLEAENAAQQNEIERLRAQNAAQEERLRRQEVRLARLEALLLAGER